jgi:hypothetical protein
MRPAAAKLIRCALYTRVSTEHGLEQDFNSLRAQREACAAYVASQRHEGWWAAPTSLVPRRIHVMNEFVVLEGIGPGVCEHRVVQPGLLVVSGCLARQRGPITTDDQGHHAPIRRRQMSRPRSRATLSRPNTLRTGLSSGLATTRKMHQPSGERRPKPCSLGGGGR